MGERAVEMEQRGAVAWVWLSRPELHNAFNAEFIAELTEVLHRVGRAEQTRVVVLAARGRSFCAGAQAQWMQQQGAASPEQNLADARTLGNLFRTLAELPKPTVARVQGAALGGGVGLVCACDIAIGASTAVFGTTEVRLGLIPATIAPYVVRAIGARQACRLFQTGERIGAYEAQQMGLLHVVTEPEQLDETLREVIKALLLGAPGAQREAKQLVRSVSGQAIGEELISDMGCRLAARRADAEAAEGLHAFLQKRPAAWVSEP